MTPAAGRMPAAADAVAAATTRTSATAETAATSETTATTVATATAETAAIAGAAGVAGRADARAGRAFTRAGSGWRYRLESLPIDRARGGAISAGLVAVAAAVHAVNLTSAPQRLAEEGDVVSRAWAVENLGALGTGTYTYDGPPLGWLQLGAWTWLTGAFDRGPTAVGAVRPAMLLALVVSAGLLWVLARRLGLPRWAAATALALFGLSPLAVDLHRQVLVENLAVPWILAAFVLATSPDQRRATQAGAGLCLGAAVLTSGTALLLVPALALLLWRSTAPDDAPGTRWTVLAVTGSAFLLVCGAFAVVAAARGELLPGDGGPSLVEGAWHQAFGRPSTGSLLDGDSVGRRTLSGWLALDPVGPVLTLAAAPVALLALRPVAPMAAGFLAVAAIVVRPGYLPPSLPVILLPLGTVLVAGAAAAVWRWYGDEARTTRGRLLVGAGALLAVVTVAAWAGDLGTLLGRDADGPLRDATRWIAGNVAADETVVVDDAIWVDLVEAGADPDRLTGYAALDADTGLGADRPRPWPDHDLVVTTASFRSFPGAHPSVAAAVRGSVLVAAFGSGADRVEVRRIAPGTPFPGPAAG